MLLEYIDYEAATKRILKDYEDKIWQLEQFEKQIQEIDGNMTSAKNKVLSSVRVSGGSSQSEEVLVKAIDKKMLLEKGVKDINYYTDTFLPAWGRLTDEERLLLTERYIRKRQNYGDWTGVIKDKLYLERTAAYEHSDWALVRLTKLLWGRC